MEFVGIGVAGLIVSIGSLWGYWEIKRSARTAHLLDNLRQYEPLYLTDRWEKVLYRLDNAGADTSKWQRGILLVTHKRIAIYPFVPDDPDKAKALVTIQPNELRGFWDASGVPLELASRVPSSGPWGLVREGQFHQASRMGSS